jgi:hypothetical protein
MPLAEAKLLAIEDDRSRAVARAPGASLGGCCSASDAGDCLVMSTGTGSGSGAFLMELTLCEPTSSSSGFADDGGF